MASKKNPGAGGQNRTGFARIFSLNTLLDVQLVADAILLLVVFNNLRRPHLCFIGVSPKLSQGSPLAQQIPALVQLDLYLRQAVTVTIRELRLRIKTLLFFD
jgi:hypothetical protein